MPDSDNPTPAEDVEKMKRLIEEQAAYAWQDPQAKHLPTTRSYHNPAPLVLLPDDNIYTKALFDPDADKRKADALEREAAEAAEVALRISTGLTLDEHGRDTPLRYVRMLKELTTPPDIKWKTFANDRMDEMIVVREIPFVSLCNHHVIPFIGMAHIGYVPDQKIAGLSKFARVVRHFAHGLQLQERLTMQIADFLERELQPRGVAVVVTAEHMCMTIRGVQSPGTKTDTSAMLGVFADHERTAKAEFLARLNGKAH